jgi:hypothetical protein
MVLLGLFVLFGLCWPVVLESFASGPLMNGIGLSGIDTLQTGGCVGPEPVEAMGT